MYTCARTFSRTEASSVGATTLSITAFSVKTLSVPIKNDTQHNGTKYLADYSGFGGATTLNITTFNVTTFKITTINIMGLFVTLSTNDT